MIIVDVAQVLANHDGGTGPLQLRPLAALEPRREPYFALLCQPDGTIHASDARIGNSDPVAAAPMYAAFLTRAVSSQAQLVVTPEYSTPWSLIDEIARGTMRPPDGAVWVLGCESITPDELETRAAQINGNPGTRLLHEPFEAIQRAQRTFVDPVVFVFWAVDQSGSNVLSFLVQFKSVVSRDPDHVELRHLYLGKDVYKFTPQVGDISLITLICSDAFEFSNELVDLHYRNLLLLHIQLNQRPGHVDYAGYRLRLFAVASNSAVEVVCLDWSTAVAVEGGNGRWKSIAGSAWYVSPTCLTVADAEVNQLHKDGVYYSIVGDRWHVFYLNYSPHALLLRKVRVFSTGPQALAARLAPEVVERTVWNREQGAWLPGTADDGFTTFMEAYAPLRPALPELCGQDPLAVERALELLEGPDGNVAAWYALKELGSIRVGDEESIRRVTVIQETTAQRHGVIYRKKRARLAQTAVSVPGEPVDWPASLADLAAGFRFRWSAESPHDNVQAFAGGRPAAFVYLGENPETDTLSNAYAKLSKARKIHSYSQAVGTGNDPIDAATQAEDRLCVAYRTGQALAFYRPTGYASITDSAGAELDDITGEAE